MTLHPIVERILQLRGIPTDEWGAFLADVSPCDVLTRQRDGIAESLPGVREAVAVILPFVRSRKKIVIFGDYDCDGVCATAILVMALHAFGATVEPFFPDRFAEGYGMTAASVDRLLREHPDVALVVTVDNGITSACEVSMLKEHGVTVVVTDHHLPPETGLPVADALVNPRIASFKGGENLCGAGVAFFLASALRKACPECSAKFGGAALVLAGLATVVDIMPLTEWNRLLVKGSLRAFNTYAPSGLVELRSRAARMAGDVRAWDYGFLLGPRVNAAGRMASARLAYDLLMESDVETVRHLAMEVHNLNAKRKEIELQMAEKVRSSISPACAAVVAHGESSLETWHPGVAGIVAARVMEDVGVPVAVAVGDHGSVRAPDGYNVHAALTASAAALSRFGGHAAAGGFSVKEGMIDEFRRLFTAACAAQYAENTQTIKSAQTREPDVWIEPADLTLEFLAQLRQLEPFGEGNEEPVFGLRAVHFRDCRPIGSEGRHASFSFINRGIPRAVWWGHGADVEALRAHDIAHDIIFTLVSSDFGGDEHLELRLLDIRPA